MSVLLVGFDSAWTASNRGAIVACVRTREGNYRELSEPREANFPEATDAIVAWQREVRAARTLVLLDQPTIVNNLKGQRPVEHLLSSVVGRRRGGVQPANRGRADMFGDGAPLWPFLARFGGAADISRRVRATTVVETFPVVAIIAWGWVLEDERPCGRLPKYNPARRKTFSVSDWAHVCRKVAAEFRERHLLGLAAWADAAVSLDRPKKRDQDKLDACLCLLVALFLAEGRQCLAVGDPGTGQVVVPHSEALFSELRDGVETDRRGEERHLRVLRLTLRDHARE